MTLTVELRIRAFELVQQELALRGSLAAADLGRVEEVFRYLSDGTLPSTEADGLVS